MSLIRAHCTECQSECEIYSEMEDHYYAVKHCPFCGAELDEHQVEEVADEDEWVIDTRKRTSTSYA